MPTPPTLKERLAELRQLHKKSAPSFAPTPASNTWTGRTKRVEPVLPQAEELVTDARDLNTLRELVALHVQHSAAERSAKTQKAPITDSIKSICNDYGLTKITCDRNKVSYYPMSRESISRQLLLDEGVSSEIIDRCTVRTDSYAVRVTPPGVNEDDDESY